MHIAIIGAGINGLMTALELIEQGCSVTILDQQQAGKAASWAGGGILSPMYPWRYPQAVNALAKYAKPLYQDWNNKLKPVTGIDFEIHETGMLIFDEEDFDIGYHYAERHHEPMQQALYIEQEQIEQINPQVSSEFKHALYFPHIANVRNPRLLQSIIHYLKQHPHVRWLEHTPVRKIKIGSAQIDAVQTEQGDWIAADQFVFSTGAWSAQWSLQLKRDIPVHPVQGQMVLFKTPEHWLPTMCMNQVMYLIPRQDGYIVCGSSMREVGFSTTPAVEIRQKILDASFEMVPELAEFPIVQEWAGLRPGSPQGIPYIGQLPNLKNGWANFGHFRNGLCMAPASAILLRQLIFGQSTLVDSQAYAPDQLQLLTAFAH